MPTSLTHLLLLAGLTATSVHVAPKPYWVCQGPYGVRAAQDRACAPDQQTISAPAGREPVRTVPSAQPPQSLMPAVAPAKSTGMESTPQAQRPKPTPASVAKPVFEAIRNAAIGLFASTLLLLGGGVLLKKLLRKPRSGGSRSRPRRAREATSARWTQPVAQSPSYMRPSTPELTLAKSAPVASTTASRFPASGTAPLHTPASSLTWRLELLVEMDWKRFEELCQEFWTLKGFPARSTGPGADGGVDVVITERNSPDKTFAIVQCKSHAQPIGVAPVRELWGCKDHFKASLAIFYSVSGFHPAAKEFAAGKHLKLIDGPELLKQIQQLPAADQATLLTKITQGDYTTPSCPKCEIKLIRRVGKGGRPDFWGCKNFRRCGLKPRQVRISGATG